MNNAYPGQDADMYQPQNLDDNNLYQQQQPSYPQYPQQQRTPSGYDPSGLEPKLQSGREKSMYQIEYQPRTADILQSIKAKPQDSMQYIMRNPMSYLPGEDKSNRNSHVGSKMQSEKQYQEQLVMQEAKKFKEQQVLIDQEKRRRELEFREIDLQRRQVEAEKQLEIQHQQEERERQQREADQSRINQERERQRRLEDEAKQRELALQQKERELQEKEQQIINAQTPLKSRASKAPQQIQSQFQQPKQHLLSQQNSESDILQQFQEQSFAPKSKIPTEFSRIPQDRSLQIPPQNIPAANNLEGAQLSQSHALNGRYYQTPLVALREQKQLQTQPLEQPLQQSRSNSNSRSLLVAKSVLSPMTAILQQQQAGSSLSQQQQDRQQFTLPKQVSVLAVVDSDSRSREDVTKFFQVRGIADFQVFSVPGGPAGLVNDKGWLDTFFSVFSFMRQAYDFSDIFIFSSTSSQMTPLWNRQKGGAESKQNIKLYHIAMVKQAAEAIKLRVNQLTRISGFLLEQRGISEKVI